MSTAGFEKAQSFNEIFGSPEFSVEAEIIKADDEKRVVYGWASVIEKDGLPVVDLQGDIILVDDLMNAAHAFMALRKGSVVHSGDHVSDLVESIVLTKDVQDSLGIDLGQVGWFIGMKVNDDEVWGDVKNGKLTSFSIGGQGQRIEADGFDKAWDDVVHPSLSDNDEAIAKTVEGIPGGSFTACVAHFEAKGGVDDPKALCATLEHKATGHWPGESVGKHTPGGKGHDQKSHGRKGGGKKELDAGTKAAMQDYMFGFYNRLHSAKARRYCAARVKQLLGKEDRPAGMSQKFDISREHARRLEYVIAKVWASGREKYGV